MGTLKVDTIQDSGGNTILSSDGSGGFTNSLPAGKSAGFRNIIINGDMSIAQRGTSTASITSGGYYTVDRFTLGLDNLGTFTMSQDTDVPSGQGFAKSLKLDCTTADATPSGSDYMQLNHIFEGQNLQYLKKGTASASSLTLSFWVKSTKTGTFIAELVDLDNSRQISKSYTIDSASTWEKKTVTFAGDTTGAFGNDNGGSLALSFWLGAGINFTSGTLSTSWSSITNSNRAVGQVNLADSTSNDFWITGVQLEAGTTASDFEFLPFDVNLQRCQRYFWKSYEIGDAPGSSPNYNSLIGRYVDTTTSYGAIQVPHVNLRGTPTVVIYNPFNGTTGQLITDGNVAKTAASDSIGSRGGGWIYANNASVTTSASLRAHLTLNAEL